MLCKVQHMQHFKMLQKVSAFSQRILEQRLKSVAYIYMQHFLSAVKGVFCCSGQRLLAKPRKLSSSLRDFCLHNFLASILIHTIPSL